MDPNLFHLDWDRVWEVVTAVAVLAVLLERALSVVFDLGLPRVDEGMPLAERR